MSRMQEYIEGAPHRIKVGCFAGGAAIVLNGLLSVIDIFDVSWCVFGGRFAMFRYILGVPCWD